MLGIDIVLILGIIALVVVVGLVVGLVRLLVNPHTRIVGIILLGLLSLPAVLLLVGFVGYRLPVHVEPQRTISTRPAEATVIRIPERGHRIRRTIVVPVASSAREEENEDMHVADAPPSGAVSFIMVILGILALAVVISLVVGLVLLVANPRTRIVGIVVLCPLAAVGAMLFFALINYPAAPITYRPVPKPVPYPERAPASPTAPPPMVAESPEAPNEPPERVAAADTKKSRVPIAVETVAKGDSPIFVERKSGQSPNRPAWLDAAPGRQGDSYCMTKTIGPYSTIAECERELPNTLQTALWEYADLYLGQEPADRIQLPEGQLEHAILKERFEETVQSSVGPMVQLHLRLEFDPATQALIKEAWHRTQVAGRLWLTATGLATVLALLTVLLGYMKIDIATGGAYRGRLRLAAVAATLAAVTAAYLTWRA
jgi:hypothetical protein